MNPLSSIPRLLLPLLLFAAIPAKGHEDTLITREAKTGKLEQLPEQYLPASFDSTKRILRIKDRQMEFPPFLKAILPKAEDSEYLFSASWYHRRELMPPYLNIQVKAKGGEFRHAILIDLETLRIFGVTKLDKKPDGSVTREEIDLAPWATEISQAIIRAEG
jgi:hypothetical protein